MSADGVQNGAIGEWVAIEQLLPWDRNPKAHPAENVASIARSIKRSGFAAPIVAWRSKRQIVAGHGRLLAAQMLYRENAEQLLATDQPSPGMVPVRWMEFATDGEAAALAIADNRLTEANPMDDAAVADILREMRDSGTSIEGLGYADETLAAMLDNVGVNDVKWKEFDESIGGGRSEGQRDQVSALRGDLQ